MVSISGSDSSNLGISSCGRAIPRVKGSRNASTGWRLADHANAEPANSGCRRSARWHGTRRNSSQPALALGDELIAFRRHRLGLAQALQAILAPTRAGSSESARRKSAAAAGLSPRAS